MRSLILFIILSIAGCANTTGPRLASLETAPESIREAVWFDDSDRVDPVEHYALIRRVPHGGWIDLGAAFEDGRVYVQGLFSYDDTGVVVPIDRVCVDTGSNGMLSMPLSHELAKQVWVSEEYGVRASRVLRGVRRTWRGVGTSFSVSGVEYRPIPVTISESVIATPLLGQEWFELAVAAWIDPSDGLLAVTFDRNTADELLMRHPGAWVERPWRSVKPGGHRFVPVRIGGLAFEAVIDTGMEGEMFLDVAHPPSFVRKPWARSHALTPAGPEGPLWGATSNESLVLGGFEIGEPDVTWFGTRSTTLPDTPGGRSFAILGLRFLLRCPVLLDPANDRVFFYVGDPSQRPDRSVFAEANG